jgi:methylmalonyl-CoA/ethylmalonyl-CoA epimerase|tara:strand:+ start:85 stop:507 length:423 start_codon:yes stop_codon:yes gene_type:complete
MKKIEHIGIAVKDLEVSNKLFSKLFNTSNYAEEVLESEGVKTSFFKIGDEKIELLQGLNANSVISRFIKKKGEGVHHIAFEVVDIRSELIRLKEEGFELIDDIPKRGADNKLVAFIHPKSTNGVLIELCQDFVSLKKNFE